LDNILTANVSYPKYLSKNLVDLFKKIFVVDAKKRITCEKIKQQSWFTVYFNINIFINIQI
jgi:hypothetical protein